MRINRFIPVLLLIAVAGEAFAQQKTTRDEYIQQYKKLAIEARDTYGIPASITMAQGLLESDNGNSRLACEANNHFGIKCKKEWKGETISHDDDQKGECFRKYSTAEDSYRDHSVFLHASPRYASLFNLRPTDYQGWAYGLKTAGYATSPTYAVQLIKIIEDNGLFLLDDMQATPDMIAEEKNTFTRAVTWGEWQDAGERIDVDNYMVSMRSRAGYSLYTNNGSEFVLANKDDTYESLGRAIGISPSRLRKLNDRDKSAELSTGDMVYLKTKAKKANNGKLIHVVEEGETMYGVAQRYGIRLNSLAAMNHRSPDSVLVVGQQLRLM